MSAGDRLQLQGDEEALFTKHASKLRRAVASKVRAPEAVIEDACQQAWIILIRTQPERSTAFPWLLTVATHEAWRLAQRENREASLDFELEGNNKGAASPVGDALIDEHASSDRRIEFFQALDLLAGLPARQKQMIALQAAGLSMREIAQATGDSYRTVDRQLARAKRQLRQARDA